jgi:serine/threonine-protein kinase
LNSLQQRLAEALRGRYTIQSEIGRGGLAYVFLAEEHKHRRRVAVKVLRPSLAGSLRPARFRREIAIAAKLHHPHIVPLFDSDGSDDLLYFTMPYVEGETLRALLARRQRISIEDAIRMARQVASGLSYSHAQGIIHRDVKPENVLISGDVPQIADFGIARGIHEATSDRITATGLVVGTPLYMSPEQGAGTQELDERTDLYSLGCVLYEMLVGAPPFTGPSPRAIIMRHAMNPVPSIRNVRPNVPERLERAVMRALAKEPGDRHDSVAEFAAQLAEIESNGRPRFSSGARTAVGSSVEFAFHS